MLVFVGGIRVHEDEEETKDVSKTGGPYVGEGAAQPSGSWLQLTFLVIRDFV